MRVYIAGPMRGYAQMNALAFYERHNELEKDGHIVVNPQELDVAEANPIQDPQDPTRDEMARVIIRDLLALQTCDAITFLPGWEDSPGARVELAFARFLGIEVM